MCFMTYSTTIIKWINLFLKSCIWERKNPSTDADRRTDSILERLRDLSAQSNSEHLPVLRAPREGGLGPRKNADSVHPKNLPKKGTNRPISRHCDYVKEPA